MATTTFSSLPAEMHAKIAKHCDVNDLINLCRTSKLMKVRCLPVLYRHVDLLPLDRHNDGFCDKEEYDRLLDANQKKHRFFQTLLSHPEYGKHVRFFKDMLGLPTLQPWSAEDISSDELSLAEQSLTRVQSVDIGTRNGFAGLILEPRKQLSIKLFQCATSVRLVGQMKYSLAKSILNAINPATLKHLSLDMVQESKISGEPYPVYGERGEDGRIIARGALSGLLATLTGRCIALQTLVLRREGQCQYDIGWHAAAEDASYIEWTSFICSVQGTVEEFTFEHSGQSLSDIGFINDDMSLMGERFHRIVLPAILSGNWPCLKIMTLRGVRSWKVHGGNPTLIKQTLVRKLRAALGENAEILVSEYARYLPDLWEPSG